MVDPDEAAEQTEQRLGYRFRDRTFLYSALTHASVIGGQGPCAAERLEFLGDAVVGLVISDLLFRAYPEETEGRLSPYRAALVNQESLAAMARAVGVADALILGKGEEKSGGRGNDRILAAAYEAVVAAVYLDGGYPQAAELVAKHFAGEVESVAGRASSDPKTELQEACQARFRRTPEYRVAAMEGPDHARWFRVEVVLDGDVLGSGEGSSKRIAERAAAREALLRAEEEESR